MKKLNEILGTEFPIIQGGMANIATGEFAAACSNAGALGVIATGHMKEADMLRKEIRICKSLTDKPFGVNLMLMNPCADEMARIIVEEGVQVVTTGAGNSGKYIPAWKAAGIKVIPVAAAAILAKRLVNAGADAIMWDTLFASGSIMSKAMWKDMEAEPMAMLAKTVRDHGCMNMVHNCGQKIYFDVQIEAIDPVAISFLFPPDDCADYAECKRKYGDKVALIGCVTPANAVIGTDEEWDKQCTDQIDAMAPGGGFMLATGCEYPANATFDRARRMIEIAKTYGAYQK